MSKIKLPFLNQYMMLSDTGKQNYFDANLSYISKATQD